MKKNTILLVITIIFLTSCGSNIYPIFPVLNNNSNIEKQNSLFSIAKTEVDSIYNSIDIDKDSKISKDESNLSINDLNEMDINNDGKISKDESIKYYTNQIQYLSQGQTTFDNNFVVNSTFSEHRNINPASQFQSNKVELFIDGNEIYPMVYETLNKAKSSIQIDLFVLGGKIGQKVADILIEKFKSGVDVRVIHDPSLGFGGPTKKQIMPVIESLKNNGVPFRLYPINLMPTFKKSGLLTNRFQIDHNKLMVIDKEIAIMGGMNMFDAAEFNHDLMFKITGPLAIDLSKDLEYEWNLPGNPFNSLSPYLPDVTLPQLEDANYKLRVIKTDINERSTKTVLIDNINNAKSKIYIAMFEFSDPDIIAALVKAKKRGIDVRVLFDRKNLNGKYIPIVKIPDGMPNLYPIDELLKVQTSVKWYNPQLNGEELHMKLAIFDSKKVICGSSNFTTQALTTFRETSFEMIGDEIPLKLEKMFLHDWEVRGTLITKLTLKQKLIVSMIKFMDKRYISWW